VIHTRLSGDTLDFERFHLSKIRNKNEFDIRSRNGALHKVVVMGEVAVKLVELICDPATHSKPLRVLWCREKARADDWYWVMPVP
jgi:hypothetical protein